MLKALTLTLFLSTVTPTPASTPSLPDLNRTLTPGTPIPMPPIDERTPEPGTPAPLVERVWMPVIFK